MSITFTDIFCGAGGSSIGLAAAGFDLRLAANHWDRAIETHSANFPDADHLCADVSNYDMRRLPSTDVLWASPECFPAGTLITTARGQVPIEDVELDDLVLTHTGAWRPVVRTQNKLSDTITVVGQGHDGLEVTPNHAFWMRDSARRWDNAVRDYRRVYEPPAWRPIGTALEVQACWATPTQAGPPAPAEVPLVFGADPTAALWLLGRWLGDGSLTFGRNHDVLLACGFHEADEVRARLAETGAGWAEDIKRTAVVFRLGDEKARDWLAEHCGHGAPHKQLPGFAITLPRSGREALLQGYLSADGHRGLRRTQASTVSHALAVSVRLLAESLGHRVSITRDRRPTWSIEGRTGAARSQWVLAWENTLTSRETATDDLHAWSRVRRIEAGQRDVRVYNIEVDGDHSYVAEGIVVRNCTWHSPAGGRKKLRAQLDLLDDYVPNDGGIRSRATMLDVIRASEVHRYGHVIVENVVEVADWPLFDWWLDGMRQLDYTPQVLCLNSAHAGGETNPHAPQWRDRLYVVFTRRGMPVPDLDPRPLAWCPTCEVNVPAVQSWKRDRGRRVGKYRSQYVYRCPSSSCRHAIVEPYVLPAAAAIDWSDLGQRIGDRKRPLAAATMRRIRAGLELFAAPTVLAAGGNTWERPGSGDQKTAHV